MKSLFWMKSGEIDTDIRKRSLSLCLIKIVVCLLLMKGSCVTPFCLHSSSRQSYFLGRQPDRDRVVVLSKTQPYYKQCCQHPWRSGQSYGFPLPHDLTSKNGLLFAQIDTATTDDIEQHETVPYKSSHNIENTNRKIGCVVELIEPETKCTVRLIGVFHGSQSSAKDVMQCISSSTDAVVLELCSDRYRDLILKKSTENLSMLPSSDGGSVESDSNEVEFEVRDSDTETIQSEIEKTPRPNPTSWFD